MGAALVRGIIEKGTMTAESVIVCDLDRNLVSRVCNDLEWWMAPKQLTSRQICRPGHPRSKAPEFAFFAVADFPLDKC